MLANFLAFDPRFRGGVTVAAGDVNGNGRIDLVVGSGPGQRVEVSIIKGTDLQNVSPNGRISAFALLGSLFPLGNTFTKGVNVATGNLKGFLCLSFLNPSGISIAYIRAIAMHTRSASA